jgi:enoyl-CoA hydratase/carnithine racemase
MGSLQISKTGQVGTVVLSRPEVRNALSDEFLGEIVDACAAFDLDGDVGCVVIAGQPDYFSVGADLHELAKLDPTEVLLGRRAALWRALREVRLPLVAAVSGLCLGGGFELALSCDLIVASTGARFGQPETALGLIPGGGGSQLLVHLVGRAVAADLLLTGRRLSADEALALGLVSRVCDVDDLRVAAEALAAGIAARPPVGRLLAKQALNAALAPAHSGGIPLERALYNVALTTDDARQKLEAFSAQHRRDRGTEAGA